MRSLSSLYLPSSSQHIEKDLCDYRSSAELWPEAACSTTLSAVLLPSQQGGEKRGDSEAFFSFRWIEKENKQDPNEDKHMIQLLLVVRSQNLSGLLSHNRFKIINSMEPFREIRTSGIHLALTEMC